PTTIAKMPEWSPRLASTAKITTCAIAFPYCPLYMAPTPGINPSRAASIGCGVPVKIGVDVPAAPPRSLSARHVSQKMEPPTLRTQSLHNGLPQNWQKADEGTSG